MSSTKLADLAGPGIGTYEEVDQALPTDYRSLLDPKETQHAIHALKRYIEDGLCAGPQPVPCRGAADREPRERRQ